MRALAAHVPVERDDLLDTAGTGGGRSSFNVSTTAALIAAGAGCAVAKHGNRSATSRSGSADLLEALGARIDLGPGAGRALHRARPASASCSRPPTTRRRASWSPCGASSRCARSSTCSGPLTNPAGARRQLIGVSDARFLEPMAGALASLGRRQGAARRGRGRARRGLRERAHAGPGGQRRGDQQLRADARGGRHRAGRQPSPPPGGTPAGERRRHRGDPHSRRRDPRVRPAGEDLALINAGAAIYAAGRADTIAEGVRGRAGRARATGAAARGAGALRAGEPRARARGRRA